MWTKHIVMINLQYIHISNLYVVSLTLVQWYMSMVFQFPMKLENILIKRETLVASEMDHRSVALECPSPRKGSFYVSVIHVSKLWNSCAHFLSLTLDITCVGTRLGLYWLISVEFHVLSSVHMTIPPKFPPISQMTDWGIEVESWPRALYPVDGGTGPCAQVALCRREAPSAAVWIITGHRNANIISEHNAELLGTQKAARKTAGEPMDVFLNDSLPSIFNLKTVRWLCPTLDLNSRTRLTEEEMVHVILTTIDCHCRKMPLPHYSNVMFCLVKEWLHCGALIAHKDAYASGPRQNWF